MLHEMSFTCGVVMISTATLLAFTLRSCVTVAVAGNVRRTSVQLREPSISTVNVDDAFVLRAVVEHTILPAVLRSNSGRNRSVLVLIEDRSSTLGQSQALESALSDSRALAAIPCAQCGGYRVGDDHR